MRELTVPAEGAGSRLDVWLRRQAPDCSRARIQSLIRAGLVRVNGETRKPHHPLRGGDRVEYEIPPPEPARLAAQDIPLDILYEDADILVLNKPAGLVVHPAAGHADGTLVNALLHHCPDLGGIGGEIRPGIVHRLDKDTSGVLVIAKNDFALHGLAAQFKERTLRKEYLAAVWGEPKPPRGVIRTLIGRNPRNRKKMSARPASGRPAVTHYEVLSRHGGVSLLRVRIETGRTHQIRVHLAHIGHPVVGDRQYGRARKGLRATPPARQMLHAERLAFTHPRTRAPLEFAAPIPQDLHAFLRDLAADGRPERSP